MNKIGFNLEKINTIQFAIIESSFNSSNNDIGLETSLKFGINNEDSAIVSIVKFQFEQIGNPFLIIESSCEFSINKNNWLKFTETERVIIPKKFLSHLAMIAIGTARGILHSKTDNTAFNEFILPTINVSEIITEDGNFDK